LLETGLSRALQPKLIPQISVDTLSFPFCCKNHIKNHHCKVQIISVEYRSKTLFKAASDKFQTLRPDSLH